MNIKHTLYGDGTWNGNALSVSHASKGRLLVKIHDEGCSQEITLVVDAVSFLDLCRAVAIVEGQKLPPKPISDGA